MIRASKQVNGEELIFNFFKYFKTVVLYKSFKDACNSFKIHTCIEEAQIKFRKT